MPALIARHIAGLRERLRRPRWRRLRTGRGAVIASDKPLHYVRAYVDYVVDLFAAALQRADVPLALAFGTDAPLEGEPLPAARLEFQFEHVLVKPGGRDSEGAVPGGIALPEGDGNYLVRLQRRDALRGVDAIVDYSHANLANARTAKGFEDYLDKAVVIAPLLFEPDLGESGRDIAILSLIADTRQPRRRRVLDALARSGLPVRNERHTYAAAGLRALYRRTRILVNLHQTDHHDTLEELRILPALACGALVVSEDVPLKSAIPCADFIVWCRYGELEATVREVHAHYAEWRERLFGGGRLQSLLQRLAEDNRRAAAATVLRLAAQYGATGQD
jgi:hypothetical protein